MAANATTAAKPAAKAQFVRYLSNTHYASANLALYKNGDKFIVRFEVFGRAKSNAVRSAERSASNLRTYLRGITFDSAEEAREWFESIDGDTDTQKLFNLIDDSLDDNGAI